MAKATTSPKRQASALPHVLRKEIGGKKLSLYREKTARKEEYRLENGNEILFSLNPWHYHVLNALFSYGGDQYPTLLVNVNDRFGLQLTQGDIESLFAELEQRDLFDPVEARKHPLIAAFQGSSPAARKAAAAKPAAPTASKAQTKKADAPKEPLLKRIASFPRKLFADARLGLIADLENAAGPDDVNETPVLKMEEVSSAREIFRPTEFLRKYYPTLANARYLVYPMPFLVFAAVFIAVQHASLLADDISRIFLNLSIVAHVFLGLVTVNALTTLTEATVIYGFGGTVNAISLKLYFGFMPRFYVKFEDAEKFNRRQKLWVYAAPAVTRLAVFSLGILLWDNTRYMDGILSQFGAAVAFLAFASFLVTICPFYKSTGYYFMVDFLNEPRLRGKAVKVLLNKFNKNAYSHDDSPALLAYALVSIVFLLALAFTVFTVLYGWLDFRIGNSAVVITGVLVTLFALRTWKQLKNVNTLYHQNYRFERWRERALPTDDAAAKPARTRWSTGRKVALGSLLLMLFFPYTYQPSGVVTLMPATQQQISTDIAGIVDEVFHDGGEVLPKDTVIARLATSNPQAQLDIEKAKLEEKKVQQTYTKERFDRQKQLFDSKAISQETFDAIRKDYEAAEAAIPTIQAQIKLYEDQIARSEFRMPFTGTLKTLHLKEKKGHFLAVGEPFASAEDTSSFKAELEIPEADLAYVKVGDTVEIRTRAYPDRTFHGTVKTIDANVEGENYGHTLKMVMTIDTGTDALKSGMTGFAKTSGESISFWKVLTRAVTRFITVDLWAWVP